jgi:hypothetical protein
MTCVMAQISLLPQLDDFFFICASIVFDGNTRGGKVYFGKTFYGSFEESLENLKKN